MGSRHLDPWTRCVSETKGSRLRADGFGIQGFGVSDFGPSGLGLPGYECKFP